MEPQLTVYAVSDGSGELAESLVRAALVQFAPADVEVVRRSKIRTPDQVREVVWDTKHPAIILHTLVSDELRRVMVAESRLRGVDSLDMMGPMLDRFANHLGLTPQEKPGLFKQLDEAKRRQIEAVEFAFRHDDGRNIDGLERAEVVLVGVSRTMKTPTMLYLAYRGWFAANVPLMPEVAPPAELLAVPKQRVFCLRMNPSRLQELRRSRAETESIPAEIYAAPAKVREELLYSDQLCLRQGWRRVEVTGRSVEEVSREIIALLPAK